VSLLSENFHASFDILDNSFFHFRLTAFVVKSFSGAQSYIYIDAKSLNKSSKFILSTQQKDGSFKEPGSVSSYLQVYTMRIDTNASQSSPQKHQQNSSNEGKNTYMNLPNERSCFFRS
jgi:hypothetical protein